MKRCPECRRDYYDDTLLYCLDDGNALLDGPASGDEPATAVLLVGNVASEAPTRNLPVATVEKSLKPVSRWTKVMAAVVVVIAAGFLTYRYAPFMSGGQIQSIAVLPFQNEGGAVENEYLSDGMTESLIGSLSQIPNLNVKARSSVFRYKGKEIDLKKIAEELNVQAIVSGQVIQRGDNLILNLELVDAASENVIWTEKYNRRQSDIISLQTEIARDVSNKLRLRLSGTDEQKLAKSYTANPEAYRLYLQGRFFWNKRGAQNLKRAIEYFEQAVAIDPNYALAYSGIADAHSSGDSKSLEYAMKALALDDSLAEAHTSLGIALLRDNYDFAGAERAYRRAIELNPNYATAHMFYCRNLDAVGRHNEADTEIRRAMDLEPLSLPVNWFYGIHLYVIRDYEASVVQLRKTVELDASFVNGQISLGDALVLSGKFADAVEQLAKQQDLEGNPSGAAFIREKCAGVSWQECWRTLMAANSRVELVAYTRARMLAELGEKDKAFAELEKAYQQRQAPFLRLKVDPRLDNLRDDPRYAELIKKVGFPV